MAPALARAMTIDADVRSGTIIDVDHVVILMQENRSFDHYFGVFPGVRGFADRFPIPVADTDVRKGKTCWVQANPNGEGRPPLVSPFPLNTADDFRLMRVEGTPHSWPDAQASGPHLTFRNEGSVGAVFHVYDRLRLDRTPRRYTIGVGDTLDGDWEPGAYDLWVLGPNGFHRHLTGDTACAEPVLSVEDRPDQGDLVLRLTNTGGTELHLDLIANAYAQDAVPRAIRIAPGGTWSLQWPALAHRSWYDVSIRCPALPGYSRRLAGRLETGRPSISDPAMGGPALLDQV